MGTRTRPRAWAARVVATVLLVTACGTAAGSPTAAPTATAAPTPTASPAPTPDATPDVAGAFLKKAADPDSRGTAEITGELTIAGLKASLEGGLAFRGQDSASYLAVTFAGNEQVSEQIRVRGTSWSRKAPGPWLQDVESPDEARTLGAVLRTLSSMENAGVERQGGRSLYRLRPPGHAPLPPEALGFDDPSIRDATFGLQFLVAEDGTPTVMEVDGAWTQAVEGGEVAATLSLTYELDWGKAVTIQPPDDVWLVHESPLGYRMAYPPDWTVASDAEGDEFLFEGYGYVFVSAQPVRRGTTTQQFRDQLVQSYATQPAGVPASDEAVALGGQAAHRLTYYIRNIEGGENAIFTYVTVSGGKGWEVFMVTAAGAGEGDDLALLEMFVATFAFAE
jgi:hypothetical protein